ncbi:uncharacterized protein SPSK_00843 [Sporothrix schenckii 1099-18]|uniref:Uncharacterized protein n=1 Tax=Sporothrix schenckii 1099-18 TaxID=1397361 RepID=A0A0F2LXM3_SPOSC|nr:uncharacterized protein SPSK_00843 [Sporothrix schenckii 1099-18]KJR81584.1 hypothetical protein SPSK_00843 [Sporothrix schenckii 1099-18]
MATTVGALINEHPAFVDEATAMMPQSNKAWTHSYLPIKKLRMHTYMNADMFTVTANFDVFAPENDDDVLRMQQEAHRPNVRRYRLYSEEDGISWFHNEVSNVLLPAFHRYPIVTQTSHHPPPHGSERVDFSYIVQGLEGGRERPNIAIGEFKRNIIRRVAWQEGNLDSVQSQFSRELRGYAHKYNCPQIFCFDNTTFLMLQFRISKPEDILTNCTVDCWVFPRDNVGGTPIRYAFYRLLVQGFRRVQGMRRFNTPINNTLAESCTFFSGKPHWRLADGTSTSSPFGCTRKVDPVTGGVYWLDQSGEELVDDNGNRLWDTGPFWLV